ncbi:cell division protein FtsA, partial [Parabacteroides distasonis]
NDPMRVRKPGDLAPGTVQTAAEKKLAEEEAERQRLEKEAEQQRQKEKQEEEERRRRRESSLFYKGWKKIKEFGKVMTSPEEE